MVSPAAWGVQGGILNGAADLTSAFLGLPVQLADARGRTADRKLRQQQADWQRENQIADNVARDDEMMFRRDDAARQRTRQGMADAFQYGQIPVGMEGETDVLGNNPLTPFAEQGAGRLKRQQTDDDLKRMWYTDQAKRQERLDVHKVEQDTWEREHQKQPPAHRDPKAAVAEKIIAMGIEADPADSEWARTYLGIPPASPQAPAAPAMTQAQQNTKETGYPDRESNWYNPADWFRSPLNAQAAPPAGSVQLSPQEAQVLSQLPPADQAAFQRILASGDQQRIAQARSRLAGR